MKKGQTGRHMHRKSGDWLDSALTEKLSLLEAQHVYFTQLSRVAGLCMQLKKEAGLANL